MEETICIAIKSKERLQISYRGKAERIIEPHAFGTDEKGELKLRAYQKEGYSKSRKSKGWKLFKVDHVNIISELNENFHIRPDYNPQDPVIINIICKL